MHEVTRRELVVLRLRRDVPGVGRRIARHFGVDEVVCGTRPRLAVQPGTLVFNYGRSQWPIWFDPEQHTIINSPDAVGRAVNKLTTLEVLAEGTVPLPEFTHSHELAQSWLDGGDTVYERMTATGRQGAGINILGAGQTINPDAVLWVKEYPKTHEFRYHVFEGQVIDFTQKKRRRSWRDTGLINENVRNRKGGWVYAHRNRKTRAPFRETAIEAVRALGLDYGGVDLMARFDGNELIDYVVCEVNSAPGMSSPTTFRAYTNKLEEIWRRRHER